MGRVTTKIAMDIGKGWDGQKAQWVGRLNRSDGKITVGVCAREKKARSKHMEAITSRLNREKFEVCVVCVVNSLRVRALSTSRSLRLPQAVYSQCYVLSAREHIEKLCGERRRSDLCLVDNSGRSVWADGFVLCRSKLMLHFKPLVQQTTLAALFPPLSPAHTVVDYLHLHVVVPVIGVPLVLRLL